MNLAQYKKTAIPINSGVYLYYNQNGQVIYVGKAKNLKKRTQQYFQQKQHDVKTKALVKDIKSIQTIITDSELDALFLEGELIKRYQPRYNILLRDDKSPTYIKITNDDLPNISYTRNPIDDQADYFGPFYNAYPIKQAMRYLRWIFPYLTSHSRTRSGSKINRQIGLEPSLDTKQQIDKYQHDIKQIKRYIKGQKSQIIQDLRWQMTDLAKIQQFEQAAKVRNQIYQLETLQKRVRISQVNQLTTSDDSLNQLSQLFGLAKSIRRIEGYDISHMSGTNVVSSMVVFTNGLADRASYRKFKIKIDQNNDFYNMSETLSRRANKNWQKPDLILIDGGKGQLGAAIKALSSQPDFRQIPIFGLAKKQELIIISKSNSNIKLDSKLISNKKAKLFEQADFLVVDLDNSDPIIKLLQRVRDEAHRFAVSYHSKLKTKQQLDSVLDVKGIGDKTRSKLLNRYKTINQLQKVEPKVLIKLIGQSKSEIIIDLLDKNRKNIKK